MRSALRAESIAVFEINVTKGVLASYEVRAGAASVFMDPGRLELPCDYIPLFGAIASYIPKKEEAQQLLDLVAQDNLAGAYAAGNSEISTEFTVKTAKGQKYWFHMLLILTCDRVAGDGDILALVVIKDLTQVRWVEKQNELRSRMIEGLTYEFQTVYYADLKHDRYEILRTNDRTMRRLSGVFRDSYEDTIYNFAEQFVYSHDYEGFIDRLDRQSLEVSLKNQMRFSFIFRILTGRGAEHYQVRVVRISPSPVVSEVIIGFANIEKEHSAEIRQKALMENALESAKSANEAKSSFLKNMSHDIRTPMNAIIGFTKIARANISDQAKVLDALDKIQSSSEHMMQLINNVLDMSRIESGRFYIEEKEDNLPDVIDSIKDIIYPLVLKKEQTFREEHETVIHEKIYCDRLRLTQLLLNILSNSVKYTPTGGEITFRTEELTGAPAGYAQYQFTITDNGIGMNADFLSRIYDAFEREKSTTSSRVMGSGLGMTIAKEIVDQMGGTISVDSRRGVGTRFTVRIAFRLQQNCGQPREKQDAISRLQADARIFHPVDRKEDASLSGRRVLLVEDNLLNREIAAEILRDEGIEVDMAEDGEKALYRMQRCNPGTYDLILMDIQMPNMDGYQAARSIRRLYDPVNRAVPIIAMTANAFEDDRQKAEDSGMDGYISKPVETSALFYMMRKLIRS